MVAVCSRQQPASQSHLPCSLLNAIPRATTWMQSCNLRCKRTRLRNTAAVIKPTTKLQVTAAMYASASAHRGGGQPVQLTRWLVFRASCRSIYTMHTLVPQTCLSQLCQVIKGMGCCIQCMYARSMQHDRSQWLRFKPSTNNQDTDISALVTRHVVHLMATDACQGCRSAQAHTPAPCYKCSCTAHAGKLPKVA
jgi:hypothetical protein